MELNAVLDKALDDVVSSSVLKNLSKKNEDNTEESDSYNLLHYLDPVEVALEALNLKKYSKLFLKNNITFEIFIGLTTDDLKELGITDENDIQTLIKNISIFKKDSGPSESVGDDLKIINNVNNQLMLLHHYLSYVEFKLKKIEVIDYVVDNEERASFFLKHLIDSSLAKSTELKDRIYNNKSSNNLLNVLLKKNNLPVPKKLTELTVKKKPLKINCKKYTIIAISSAFVLFIVHWVRKMSNT